MSTKRNLAIVPALKVDDGAPNAVWTGGGDWARTTSAHASLPRTTALAGTTASSPACGRADVTPGKYYVISISVRAIGPQTGNLNVDWKTSGNVYLSTTSGAGSDYGVINMTASTTQRFAIIGQAPTNAARAITVVSGLDAGGAQVTASMVREFDTLVAAQTAIEDDRLAAGYFDGDTSGAAWDGANGESTSTLTYDASPVLTAALAGVQAAILQPQVDIVGMSLTAELAGVQAAIGLLVSAVYDNTRGRIRISAQGLAPEVVRVVVSHRAVGTARWTEVRGGRVAVEDGRFVRTVDDYEYSAGSFMEYRIQGLSSSVGEPDVVAQTRVALVEQVLDQSWIKFISSPHLNTRVRLLRDFTGATRKGRVALYDVQARRDRVAVTDVHTGREMTIRAVVFTLAARDSLDDALGQGRAVFLHTPASIPVPTMYAAVGDYSWRPAGPRSTRSIFEINLVEVAPPPPSVVGVGLTYAVLSAQFATYADLSDAFATYGDMGS